MNNETGQKAPRECWTRPRGKARLGWGGQELSARDMSIGAPLIRPNEKDDLKPPLWTVLLVTQWATRSTGSRRTTSRRRPIETSALQSRGS
jgi:hypothetical protein